MKGAKKIATEATYCTTRSFWVVVLLVKSAQKISKQICNSVRYITIYKHVRILKEISVMKKK